ncbi:MAG: NUDIX hydrolase [SAR324 cluster bacterium]|nr:NUDIX hydrolase [SAR324 cluster bacterium]
MNFCSKCGHPVQLGIPPDDDRERHICQSCGMVHYQNPKLIVGCIIHWEDNILLCKRAIEPRYGLWTTPAGFLENGESLEEGAVRETWEEARAEVEISRIFAISSLPHINQIYVHFLAKLKHLNFSPGPESEDVQLFHKDEIDWDSIAFSAVSFALTSYVHDPDSLQVYCNTIIKRQWTE